MELHGVGSRWRGFGRDAVGLMTVRTCNLLGGSGPQCKLALSCTQRRCIGASLQSCIAVALGRWQWCVLQVCSSCCGVGTGWNARTLVQYYDRYQVQ